MHVHYMCTNVIVIEFLPAELKSRLMQIKDLDECVQGTVLVPVCSIVNSSKYRSVGES